MKFTLKKSLLTFLLVGLAVSCKNVEPPKPFGVIPTEDQLNWQQLEYYMFIHFGPNTFTDVEWGDGKEDPKVFNPTDLDCRQWAATAKAAGMKGIIITAKHHDGFCLWPSKFSTHTVRESLWKDGKGDLLRELSDACKEYGLKFGVYLSPWDQNHPAYGTPEYNQIFANTLDEVLSGYGEVFEQWFDGANGGAKKQEYDWDLFHKTVYKNQPHAVIFSDVGPGCRWMGNEKGMAGETNWSTLNIKGFEPGLKAPDPKILNEGNMGGEAWIPAETDVSIRPGWFYSPSTDDKVKSIEKLMDIYYTSVGRNSNLLLNVPPDRRGRIHPNDSTRLMEFRATVEASFKTNLIEGADVKASNTRGNSDTYKASNVLDNDFKTYWATDDDVLNPSIEIDLKSEKTFNRLMLQEYIALGQRVSSFSVKYWEAASNSWKSLADATTVGYKRILRFPSVTTQKLKIEFNALACPLISSVALYDAPQQLSAPAISRDKEGLVTLQCATPDPVIYYTLDGTEPSISSAKYEKAFACPQAATIKAIAAINNGSQVSEAITVGYDLAPVKWAVISPSGEESAKAIDGNSQTFAAIPLGEELIVDLGEKITIKGFSYTPVPNVQAANISRYDLSVSSDNQNWAKVKSNTIFNNIKNNPIAQSVLFDKPQDVRYIKLKPIETTNKSDKYVIAELGVVTK